ncbi:hypothetical protein ACROYT_G027828 [Oculina patagonica]
MFTKQTNFKTNIVAYLMLVSLHKVSAACCANDYTSLICCSRTTEILLIAVVIALCFVFFIQCIIIVCLAHKLSKVQKRLDLINTKGRGGSYTFYSTWPSQAHERALEETEDQNQNQNPRARRVSGVTGPRVLPSQVTQGGSKMNPIAGFDNPNVSDRDKEIWGLY